LTEQYFINFVSLEFSISSAGGFHMTFFVIEILYVHSLFDFDNVIH
jgi:hypothetical protein